MSTDGFYNGFSPAERTVGARRIKRAQASGELQPSCQCSMCCQSFDKSLPWHSEDYTDPMAAYAICGRCHYAIHIRFSRPNYWQSYIAKLDTGGWFQFLATDRESLTRPFDQTYPKGTLGWPADLTVKLEDLHSVAVDGQRSDYSRDIQRVRPSQLHLGIVPLDNSLAVIKHGPGDKHD